VDPTPGQIGAYTVEREIGRGGMGVVWLARDPRLDRAVAIKALPPDLADDPDRLARFDREARALASLHHPNIAQIFGVEESGGRRYLVLEYVDGESLADAVARGPLPVEDALRVAAGVAAGVEAAHDAGIIHRDLKPDNVRLTAAGEPKVLDFGIAKAPAPTTTLGSVTAPTAAAPATAAGSIIGTAPYMSPEQARGKPVDKRTDLWSFGVLLYEMLVARQPFDGETTTDVLAAIVERDPDFDALPPGTPHRVRDLLRKCLAKDRKERLRDIGDARLELQLAIGGREWSTTSLAGAPAPAAPRDRRRWLVPLLAACLVAISTLSLIQSLLPAPTPPAGPDRVVRFAFNPLEGLDDARAIHRTLRVAPDGSAIVYGAYVDGRDTLFVRTMDDPTPRPLPIPEDAWSPFFSPDSRWIGFVIPGRELMRMPVAGGPIETICAVPWHSFGLAAWLTGDTIVMITNFGQSLSRVPASGGELEPFYRVKQGPGNFGIEAIHPVPETGAVLASIWDGASIEDYAIHAVSLDGASRLVLDKAAHPLPLGPGALAYIRGSTLMVIPFDLASLTPMGEPRTLAERIATSDYGGSATADASGAGDLVFLRGDRRALGRSLVRVALDGAVTEISPDADAFMDLHDVSPDGRFAAVSTIRRRNEHWAYDLERHTMTLIDTDGDVWSAIWSADGARLYYAFASNDHASGTSSVRVWDRATQSTRALELDEASNLPVAALDDGRIVLFIGRAFEPDAIRLVIHDERDGSTETLIEDAGGISSPTVSPDGLWIAYLSDSQGRLQAFVRRLDPLGPEIQMTFDGANSAGPFWSPAGDELLFVNEDRVMAVAIERDGDDLRPGHSRELFRWPFGHANISWEELRLTPDDDFLMVAPAAWEREPPRVEVIVGADRLVP
jgi:serine/threonine protein kinase/Tol biopolymer transport system component